MNFTLANTGGSSSSSSSSGGVVEVPCRLLALQQGQVIVDEDVTVAVQQQNGRNRARIR
jgi:hypothetical protein